MPLGCSVGVGVGVGVIEVCENVDVDVSVDEQWASHECHEHLFVEGINKRRREQSVNLR